MVSEPNGTHLHFVCLTGVRFSTVDWIDDVDEKYPKFFIIAWVGGSYREMQLITNDNLFRKSVSNGRGTQVVRVLRGVRVLGDREPTVPG